MLHVWSRACAQASRPFDGVSLLNDCSLGDESVFRLVPQSLYSPSQRPFVLSPQTWSECSSWLPNWGLSVSCMAALPIVQSQATSRRSRLACIFAVWHLLP
mmetsp:Transcript_17061/g.51612  ORF Transcript_17061/g.51612 Transcript_17061/m.51612 type:complete len:101 (-) Transcript_17061:472-774(-)